MTLKWLFVGESPPASGRRFHHGNSGLYRAMREAFQAADTETSEDNFLERFVERGCHFTDLCPMPVDRMPKPARRAVCVASEGALAEAIGRWRPDRIVTVVRSIEPNVRRAAEQAGWTGEFLHLPYPGRWASHRRRFVRTLADYLVATGSSGRELQSWKEPS